MKILIVTAFCFFLAWPPPAYADSSLVQEKGCPDCHRFSSADPAEKHKAPDLFYAGDKFKKQWLAEFLQHPYTLRKAGYTVDPGFPLGEPALKAPHVSVSKEEAEKIADYLAELKLPGLETGKVDSNPLSKSLRARLKIDFERTYGCTACHEALNLTGNVRGGVSGPSLVNAGNRLQTDWIFNWLKSPKQFLERGRMPIFDLDDDTAAAITQYILTIQQKNEN